MRQFSTNVNRKNGAAESKQQPRNKQMGVFSQALIKIYKPRKTAATMRQMWRIRNVQLKANVVKMSERTMCIQGGFPVFAVRAYA